MASEEGEEEWSGVSGPGPDTHDSGPGIRWHADHGHVIERGSGAGDPATIG